MLTLVENGFNARKSRDEKLELQYFDLWCNGNKLKLDDTFNAETLWEKQLSQFKVKHILRTAKLKGEFICL
jgi:hypothetical protein